MAGDGLAVTIPERHYELIAGILADAVADDPTNAHDAARRHARRRGRALGAQFAEDGARVVTALDGLGFEPLAPRPGHCCVELVPHAGAKTE